MEGSKRQNSKLTIYNYQSCIRHRRAVKRLRKEFKYYHSKNDNIEKMRRISYHQLVISMPSKYLKKIIFDEWKLKQNN